MARTLMMREMTCERAARPLWILMLLLVSAGCAKKYPAPRVIVAKPGWHETGIASWYGHPYHGRRAADGSVYDMEKMTAAHPSLAFGTKVRVERLDNHKRVEVRITDRGPFVAGRIVDLSRAAARALDMLGPGTARVRITVLKPGSGRSDAAPCGIALALLTMKDSSGDEWMARVVQADEDPGSAARGPAHNK